MHRGTPDLDVGFEVRKDRGARGVGLETSLPGDYCRNIPRRGPRTRPLDISLCRRPDSVRTVKDDITTPPVYVTVGPLYLPRVEIPKSLDNFLECRPSKPFLLDSPFHYPLSSYRSSDLPTVPRPSTSTPWVMGK